MSNDLLDRPSADEDEQSHPLFDSDAPRSVYDDEFEKMVGRGQHDEDPESKKHLNTEELSSLENNPAEQARSKPEQTESSLLGGAADTLGAGYSGGDESKGTLDRLRSMATNGSVRRKSIVGGLLGGTIVVLIFGSFSFVSLEAIHIRENMLSCHKSNSLVCQALARRSSRNFMRKMQRIRRGATKSTFQKAKLDKRMAKNNLRVIYDDKGPKALVHDGPDGPRRFDFDTQNFDADMKKFLDSSDGGRAVRQSLDGALNSRAGMFKGTAAKGLYRRMGVRLTDWTSRKPRVDTNDPNVAMADRYRGAVADDIAATQAVRAQLDNTPRRTADQFTASDTSGSTTGVVGFEGLQEVDSLAGELDDPTVSFDEAAGIDTDLVDELSSDPGRLNRMLDTSLTPSGLASMVDELKSQVGPRAASRLDNAALKTAKGISVTEPVRIGCRVRGTIESVGSVKNMYAQVQLASFAVRFLTVPDRQKAGLIRSDGVKVMMAYLHTKNPVNGKTYAQAGGFQNVIMGNKNAKPSPINQTRYNTGRGDNGILGAILGFMNRVPGVNSTRTCKVVNNGWVQVGSAAIGIGAAVLSGGSVTGGQLLLAASLGVLEEMIFLIGEPILMRAVTNAVIDGFEHGEQGGEALTSSWGAFRNMNAGVNGARPLKKSKVGPLRLGAEADYRDYLARQGVFDRYFNINQSDSMVTRAAFSMPSLQSIRPQKLLTFATSLIGGQSLASLPLINGETVLAEEAEATQCDQDEQIKKLGIQTDIFCNVEMADVPDIDTDQTEQVLRNHRSVRRVDRDGKCTDEEAAAPLIYADGNPIEYPDSNGQPPCDGQIYMSDDLTNYINYCHAGRPGILYNPITDKNGASEPQASMWTHVPFEKFDNPCVEDGKPLSNDTAGVGRFARYTDWYGWLVDDANMTEEINETYTTEGSTTTTSATGGGASQVVAGDTSHLSCETGTDGGVQDGYKDGQLIKIRVCNVQGVVVNTQIAKSVDGLLTQAQADGVPLSGYGFRTMQGQIDARKRNGCPNDSSPSSSCRVPTARPGYSNHQMGLAIDFKYKGSTICFPRPSSSCSGNKGFDWLRANASKYGLKNLPSEAWHWSTDGR